jgi:hypothetical protein
MKKLLTLFVLCFGFSAAFAQAPAKPVSTAKPATAKPATTKTAGDTTKKAVATLSAPGSYTFDKMEHDYGTIQKGADPYCEFKLTNTGKTPLVIQEAHGSCGCTVPEYPKEPIKPGQTVIIRVRYDTNRLGPFEKQVTVTFQGMPNPAILKIHGKVDAPPSDQPFPAPGSSPNSGAPVNN